METYKVKEVNMAREKNIIEREIFNEIMSSSATPAYIMTREIAQQLNKTKGTRLKNKRKVLKVWNKLSLKWWGL